MAIAVDNVSAIATAAGASSINIPAFLIGGADRLCVVGVGTSAFAADLTSSVVRNAPAAENFIEAQDATIGGSPDDLHVSLHYLVAPVAGSHSITVTLAAADDELCVGALSLTGVNQTTPVGASGTAFGNDASPILALAGGVADDWLVGMLYNFRTTFSEAAGQTNRWKIENIGGFVSGGTSSKVAAAGSNSLAWSLGIGGFANRWGVAALYVKPASGGGPPPPARPPKSGLMVSLARLMQS